MDWIDSMVPKENNLIFLHVPKTAGSTFHMLLNARYSQAETFNVFGSRFSEPEIAAFIDDPIDNKTGIRLLKGHMPFGLHKYMPGHSKYISILRDPIDRVISQYYYIKKNNYNPLHEAVEGRGMSLPDFVSSGLAVGMNNGQCRFLNGDLDAYAFNDCSGELLENAKSHITEHFSWLGVTERFDESILILAGELGWEKPPFYFRENVAKKRNIVKDVKPEEIEVIKNFNSLDIQLYNYVNGLLDEQIKSVSNFSEKMSSFQRENVKLQRRWSWLPDSIRKNML
ncbi:sulfotransferase family 2 domain-containing protein [bacterium]|nr:sulfotransferase family 2 domain-containing protein [bacterium]